MSTINKLLFEETLSSMKGNAASRSGGFAIRLLLLMVMLTVGVGGAWSQTDYSGTYYIGSVGYDASKPADNYYLCPTEGWCSYKATDDFEAGDANPFVTTHKYKASGQDTRKALWVIEKAPAPNSGYYYIKHWLTNKYMVANGVIRSTSGGQDRMRVHLEEIADLNAAGNKVLFSISPYNGYLVISPKEIVDGVYYTSTSHSGHVDHKWLTVNGGNDNSLKGVSGKTGGPTGYQQTKGILGLYTQNDSNAKFYLEEALSPPVFTVNADGSVAMSSAAGTTIHYTTDGTTPTTSSSTYSSAITIAAGMTEIKAIAVSDTETSIVATLPLREYTYNIVNLSGTIAIKHTVKQAEGTPLNGYASIPETIRSSYISGEAVEFYTIGEASYTGIDQLNDENQISATTASANIYVTYTTDHIGENMFLRLRGARAFRIIVDSYYIYDDNGTLRQQTATPGEGAFEYFWTISGVTVPDGVSNRDPYNIQIQNFKTKHYIQYDYDPPTSPFKINATTPTYFIAMDESGEDSNSRTITFCLASGNTTRQDVSFTVETVEISAEYHLIDRSKKLIEVIPSTSLELALPEEWCSPLVSQYHYFKTSNITTVDGVNSYTLSDPITSPFDAGTYTNSSEKETYRIYVNYDVGNTVTFDTTDDDETGTTTYMLRFVGNCEEFYQEDGHDNLDTEAKKAVYPYANGDANLFVYGQEQWDAQLSSGASTRSRWLWYVVSPTSDPYHVWIMSHQSQGQSPSHNYFYTHVENFDDANHIVTGVTTRGDRVTKGGTLEVNIGTIDVPVPANVDFGDHKQEASEYMILGTTGRNKLVTVEKITADGISDHDTYGQRRVVDSFEQYWKTYDVIKKNVLKITTPDNPDDPENVPEEYRSTLTDKGWHRYEAWANAKLWNGYNTVSNKAEKGYEYKEHWFQTITMGNGTFEFVETSLAPQVILLDQHGWEILRTSLFETFNSTTQTLNTAGLKKYDSPMVRTYHWYPTAKKEPGYHKYTVNSEEQPMVIYDSSRKATEDRYTHNSTTLASNPYQGIIDAGYTKQDYRVMTDFYVTYTVESDYGYTGAPTEAATVASPYLLKQGGQYAQTTNGTSIEQTPNPPGNLEYTPRNMQWYLRPNFNIDREMGYKYHGEEGAQPNAKSKYETDADNYAEGRNGFDPYNVQIQSKAYPLRYFTADTKNAHLDNGVWTGTSDRITLENLKSRRTATGYDQVILDNTNATFMVVGDDNDNMRLMPRFDHTKVMESFTTLRTPGAAAPAVDPGTGVQSLFLQPLSAPLLIHSSDEITDMGGNYQLAADFTIASGFTSLGTLAAPFRGTIDGQFVTLSELSTPFVAYADGAVIKNVIVESSTVSSGPNGNVGTFVCEAQGNTRIYNCGILSGTISGSNYVGGIVGLLDGSSRVINCFSNANITGGARVGGIVGYNNFASTATDIRTMVMNCMYYGDINEDISNSTNEVIAPIYNGENIKNVYKKNSDTDIEGLSNFNYFVAEKDYVQNYKINVYNCALMAETRFLQRFEFFRHLLNSNRELAAWYATGSSTNKDDMAKWVMLPTQKDDSKCPYPILKPYDYYPSVVNHDAENAPTTTERNKGGKLETLTVTIGGVGSGAPSAAYILDQYQTFTLNITDKDPDHYDFNYGKVQLPYYHDVGEGNYTENKVVTGWKITHITGGTPGTFTTGDDCTFDDDGNPTTMPYNFADRNCTNKDLYGTGGSNRIFNQGAYWDVPEGVKAITIVPYWGQAAYVADEYNDVVYSTDMKTKYDVTANGEKRYPDAKINIYGSEQTVYKTVKEAVTALAPSTSNSVYDYAVVLVGNYHQYNGIEGGNKPYTVTSADLDGDDEPDCSFMLRFDGRTKFHPVRYDFLNLIGLGMAQKSTGSPGSYNLGIMQPQYWFEVTNTALFRVTQFEYDETGRAASPLILQGGVIEQWVNGHDGVSNNTTFFHVGGNVWFKEFHRGTHQDNSFQSKHPPLSVTGGDYDQFYLTGLYKAVTTYDDNAECYINGGRFGIVAGTGMEGIGNATNHTKGKIFWQIQNADINEFYGGGINAASPVQGNITNVITGGYIKQFCGGPKFGDMQTGCTVKTTATNCTFDTYFGAGYGGNSYSRQAPYNYNNKININWNKWVNNEDRAKDDSKYHGYIQEYRNETDPNYEGGIFEGVSTQIAYQFIPMSGNADNCARLWIEYVMFSLAACKNVTSSLTGCTVTGNFYGGGNLGKVDGNATSTLTNCKMQGNVYGAGYSANLPTVEVMKTGGFRREPYYDDNLGVFLDAIFPETVTYTWAKKIDDSWIDKTNHILYTTENLNALGTVTGNCTVNIEGTTTVAGDVYGGGALADANTGNSSNKATVNLKGGTIEGNVYGGGQGQLAVAAKAAVGEEGQEGYQPAVPAVEGIEAKVGSVTVNLNGTSATDQVDDAKRGCAVLGNIFGCNNLNGTPKGTVTVNIYKTQNAAATRITNPAEGDKTAKVKGRYDVKAVYGGGNLAAYMPDKTVTTGTEEEQEASRPAPVVNIYGCDRTSIETVYGGGNAASVPATLVTVNGSYELGEVFGGGNGKDDVSYDGGKTYVANPGANVGYKDYSAVESSTKEQRQQGDDFAVYRYGTGKAQVFINGGNIHSVYGGSNTKGNVRYMAVATLEEADAAACAFRVEEAYGGGKNAEMDGQVVLEIKCIPSMKNVFGGARNADISSDIVLNITNGIFERVYGGNNVGGRIDGSITVNIEETGCCPIKIGEIYGGGNDAPYSIYGYKEVEGVVKPRMSSGDDEGTVLSNPATPYADPQVNLRSFTSIGTVYGGGKGEHATLVGNPTVNVNVALGDNCNDSRSVVAEGKAVSGFEIVDEGGEGIAIPSHAMGENSIGAIGTIFGGGNEAEVIGSPTVNIGTEAKIARFASEPDRTNVDVLGADIRGNVYGGGNKAKVKGNPRVNVGKVVE